MIILRVARETDKENIAKLWRKSAGYIGALYMGALKEAVHKGKVNICERDNELLGFVEYHTRRDGVTVIYHIAVAENVRRQGIGYMLLKSLHLPLRLKVTADNEGAIAFYEDFGMKRIADEDARTGRALFIYEMRK